MVENAIRETVQRSRVRILHGDEPIGCGTCVMGGFIVTAAHCLEYTVDDAKMADPEFRSDFSVMIKSDWGQKFRVSTIAVEPVSDVAVLTRVDSYCPSFDDDAEAFDELFRKIAPLELGAPASNYESAFVFTHTDNWVRGTLDRSGGGQHITGFNTTERLIPGDSGSPIVNERGELVGVTSLPISQSSFSLSRYPGRHPLLYLSLPVWVVDKINSARGDA